MTTTPQQGQERQVNTFWDVNTVRTICWSARTGRRKATVTEADLHKQFLFTSHTADLTFSRANISKVYREKSKKRERISRERQVTEIKYLVGGREQRRLAGLI